MPAAPFCRENPDRAIYLNALIDQNLVNSLTPQILKLRKQSAEPITVYIDSGGGYPKLAETLLNLLQAPDADGQKCRVITAVTGSAASAAADFLAAGNYALAYPTATIHFHGTRRGGEELTMESATGTARLLREYNELLAIELAENIVNRGIFIYLSLRDSCEKIREGEPQLTDIECFSRALRRRLSRSARLLPMNAFARYNEVQKLSDFVFTKIKIAERERLAKTERSILRAVTDYEYRNTKKYPKWSFTEENMDRIVEDFRIIKDFYAGSHTDVLAPLGRNFGEFFLDETDSKTFEATKFASDKERDSWLLEKAEPKLRPLWYFIVSICRLLQEKENRLTASDSYWLGIVNEVVGSDLPSLRTVYENRPEKATPETDSPIASAQQA